MSISNSERFENTTKSEDIFTFEDSQPTPSHYSAIPEHSTLAKREEARIKLLPKVDPFQAEKDEQKK